MRPVRPDSQSLGCDPLWLGARAGVCFQANLTPPLFASSSARGCGRVSRGRLASLSGPRKAARGRRVIVEQVWGYPLCVCVFVCLRPPWERRHAQLWALLQLSAGALSSSCPRCPITEDGGGLGEVPSFFLRRRRGEVKVQHPVSTHCSPSLMSRTE